MTRVMAITNQKGGVGKTTTALCVADALRREGRRVLLVDLDQQANASRTYHAEMDGVATAYDVLTRGVSDARDAIQSTDAGDILPGDVALATIDERMASMTCRETILADALEPVISSGAYDWVVIDCAPSLGALTTNALCAATDVLVPVLVDGYSLDGLARLMELIGAVRGNRRLNPDLEVSGLVLCQRESGQRLARAFDEQLPEVASKYGTRVFDTPIRRCVKVREAQMVDQLLHDYAPGCTTDADYDALTAELIDATQKND